MWPFSIIKKQKQEIERLRTLVSQRVMDEIKIRDFNIANGELSMSLEGSPMHLFADAFYQQFKGSKAINFLTMDFCHHETGERFEVTMQKLSGESMAAQLARLKAEVAELKQENIKLSGNVHEQE